MSFSFSAYFLFLFIYFFQFSWLYSSLVFKNTNFRVLSFLFRTQRSKCLMWSSNSLLFMEKIYSLVISPNCGSLWLGCGLFPWQDISTRSYLCLSYLNAQCCPFTFCCGALFIQRSGTFSRELFHNCKSVVSIGGGEFRIQDLLYTIVQKPLLCMLYVYLSFYHMVSSYNTEESNSL